MASLPYVTASGNIERALLQIKSAATPETVSQDFVKTILGVPGGSGNQMTAYLRKIGFVGSDGKPTDIYKKFRNPSTEGWAAAQALKIGYGPLYARNEYMHRLDDTKLKGLIVEETGVEADSAVVSCVFGCIKQLKKFAKSDNNSSESTLEKPLTLDVPVTPTVHQNFERPAVEKQIGLNLGYTINLNPPATSDPAVFNAIFRALKEHLLSSSDG
ncbi:DUF5343 domain-containing protein [Dyella choica]|uniref:DUF5343 domain-containing protein n=1 Tax=Dyella choica TaxID=1927959 RepID=A0A3S0PEY7_9GAMM|nr:DUF5343 domain-containing protein [Dyella choica]RUL68350.1 hypothetical protein EKH80_23585 [Dyella choica]